MMDAALTCTTCKGTERVPPEAAGDALMDPDEMEAFGCWDCDDGRRPPTLTEWDALRAERDWYHLALSAIAEGDWQILARFADVWDARPHVSIHGDAFVAVARAALDAKEGT